MIDFCDPLPGSQLQYRIFEAISEVLAKTKLVVALEPPQSSLQVLQFSSQHQLFPAFPVLGYLTQ